MSDWDKQLSEKPPAESQASAKGGSKHRRSLSLRVDDEPQHDALFSKKDIGRTVQVKDGKIQTAGVFRTVTWRAAVHASGSATITHVDKANVTLTGGLQFQNCALEEQERREEYFRETVRQAVSNQVEALVPKLVDLKKSCDVVGSGKWPADSQEARVKLLKRIQDLALEIREQVRMQREAFLHHKMDRHFRQSVEQTTLKLQEDLRHLSADVKRRCFTMAEGRRPEEKPESLYDEASQLQIKQEDVDVEAELEVERIAGLMGLEKDFEAVEEVINDLAKMVHEQGDDVEKVEVNVQISRDNVHGGTKELAAAKSYQASARKKMAFLASGVLLAIIAGVVGLIVYLKASPMAAASNVASGMQNIQVPTNSTSANWRAPAQQHSAANDVMVPTNSTSDNWQVPSQQHSLGNGDTAVQVLNLLQTKKMERELDTHSAQGPRTSGDEFLTNLLHDT